MELVLAAVSGKILIGSLFRVSHPIPAQSSVWSKQQQGNSRWVIELSHDTAMNKNEGHIA